MSLFSPCVAALDFCLRAVSELCSCSPPPCLPVTSIDVFYFKLSALPAHRRGDAGVIKKPPELPGAGIILLLQELLYPRLGPVAGKDQPYKITEAPLDADLQHLRHVNPFENLALKV